MKTTELTEELAGILTTQLFDTGHLRSSHSTRAAREIFKELLPTITALMDVARDAKTFHPDFNASCKGCIALHALEQLGIKIDE